MKNIKQRIKELKQEIEKLLNYYGDEINDKVNQMQEEDKHNPIELYLQLEAKIQAFEEAQKIQDEKVKKLKRHFKGFIGLHEYLNKMFVNQNKGEQK